MEAEATDCLPKKGRKGGKRSASSTVKPESQIKKQKIKDEEKASEDHSESSSSGWSKEVIEPAIKSMSFRKKRGTRMKELIKGKKKKDGFWEKYQDYFGGDLDQPEDEEDDVEDYHASSSGRDQFDSDFDLTDSYVGKRGRKKGTKVKRKRKTIVKEPADPSQPPKPRGRPGRKKKVDLQHKDELKAEELPKTDESPKAQGCDSDHFLKTELKQFVNPEKKVFDNKDESILKSENKSENQKEEKGLQKNCSLDDQVGIYLG